MDNYLKDLFIDEAKAALDSRGSGGGGGKLYRHKITLQSGYFEYDGGEYYAELYFTVYRSRQDAFTSVNDLDNSILDEVRAPSYAYVDGTNGFVTRVSNNLDTFEIRTADYSGYPLYGFWYFPKSEFRITDEVMEV